VGCAPEDRPQLTDAYARTRLLKPVM